MLEYRVYSRETLSLKNEERLSGTVKEYLKKMLPLNYNSTLFNQLMVSVKLKECPLGFEVHKMFKKCTCLCQITNHEGVQCNDNFTIQRTRHNWLTAILKHNITEHHGVVINHFCPYDYCREDTDSLSFQLEFPDD